jgi:leucyl-tRNA synthetase
LRFADPHNDKAPFDKQKAEFWLPVDDYIGGAEHAVMHLLYARFWTKVMFDAGLISFDEPFSTLRNHGMILAPDGAKMSKSKGNTIEPDSLIEQGYGADSVRLMELFIGPWNQSANWNIEGLGGVFRFLQRVWTIVQEYLDEAGSPQPTAHNQNQSPEQILRATHGAIKRVTEDLHDLGFNTAIAALMEYVNQLYKFKAEQAISNKASWTEAIEKLLQLLAPFAPHISEELWQQLGHKDSVHQSKWPQWDEKYLVTDNLTIVVQVKGKVRANIQVPTGSTEEKVVAAAMSDTKIAGLLAGKELRKTVYVPNKLVNFVV